jgi:RimJ/RimL family protein N-acetyltransferase
VDDVYLRALEVADFERTQQWHNDPRLYDTLISPFRYVSHAAEEEWIRRKVAYSQTEIQLAICLREDDRHIGNIHLTDIDWISRHGHLGMFIGEAQYQSKGYGQQALRLMLRHAFRDLGLHRVCLVVLDDNPRALRVYEKCGFVVEGRLRQHVYKRGAFRDLIFMGVCAGDLGGAGMDNAEDP